MTILIGPGVSSDNAGLGQLMQQHGHNETVIRCVGVRKDIPACANAIDLLVMSSAYGEAFPNVVAEAMACGTPCVVTAVGDAPQIIARTGWVVPARDPVALAHAIRCAEQEWRANSSQWRERQHSCRQRIIERYSLDRMARSYCGIWKTVARDHGHRTHSSSPRYVFSHRP